VTGMEGRIRGLKAEIRQDAGSGSSVKKKQEELEKLEQKKLSASASQMNTLGTLNQKIADVAKEKEDEDKEVASSFTKC
jgi:hypothetical protein